MLKLFQLSLLTLRRCFIILLVVSIFVIIFFYTTKKNEDTIMFRRVFKMQKTKPVESLPLEVTKIIRFINEFNSEEKIINADIYGVLTQNTVILVVLVNKFSNDFNYFLESLSQVHGLEDVMIIFSHSYYDETLNEIIQSINFCRVLQIFYPYSTQTHPLKFPGHHPNDCPYNMKIKTAVAVNCTGAFHPDIRGYYRDPMLTENKHHWWWTANQVFEILNCTKQHTGLVIFLEDDFVFIKDFIYIASYMKNVADSQPQCDFLSMGAEYLPYNAIENSFYGVELATWDPKIHAGVIAFDLSVWNSIVSHYDLFCKIDEFSWTRSLYYISLNRRDGKKFKVISSVTPRAFKSRTCDFHRLLGCDTESNVLKVLRFQKKNEENWFPPYLELYINIELEDDSDDILDYGECNGGWADPRDKGLCRNMTASKIKKILMEMKNEFHEYEAA